ncbi:MAG: LacI family DNA-binding transcriptional regulator [Anaerolineae bacterium]|nr:LacI family DNA-binding transcriptional regulator [Anaerolineae bacterium]
MKQTKDPFPTIYDVAQASGLSIATISRALNNPEKVSPATRERVMRVIDEIGFVPKADARARALQNTGRIGVVSPFFTAPSFVQRLRGIADGLSSTHYEMVVYPVDSGEHIKHYIQTLPLTRSLDGLIIVSMAVSDDDARRLRDYQIETVLIEFPHPKLNTIEIDDFEGGLMAGQYLIDKGHRQVGFLGVAGLPEFAIHPESRRLAGFRKSLARAGLTLPEAYICNAPYRLELDESVQKLLELAERPTAIFAATDLQAMGLLKIAREKGLCVPEDLAIIGFDDIDFADYVGLTTIRQHMYQSGKLAVELLLSRLKQPDLDVQHLKIQLELVERNTA